MKAASAMRKKLEDELREWKIQLERELDEALKRLQEEDIARKELEEENGRIQQELIESKRQLKLISTDYKTKLQVESDEKRQLTDAVRRLQNEVEDGKRALQQTEKSRAESSRQREAEIQEWKKMVEARLAESMKKMAGKHC